MIVGVPKETFPNERRVALIPAHIALLQKLGCEVVVESGAGASAGFPDAEYQDKGATVVKKREDVFAKAEVVLQVRGYGANPEKGKSDVKLLRSGQLVVGFMEPLLAKGEMQALAKTGATIMAMELIPRITRAQSMDALSSMANLAGYKAVILAADHLPKIFPMMMTAAGTIVAAKVFVVGAGVAGLQAIATARRLGAVVQAYDIRPAVKEQVQSLGAKFVELELEVAEAEDKGGYAKAMDEEFYRKQREMMTRVVAESDVVITTAAVPGKKAPILITEEMVKGMPSRSVIVDLAAERGGNCELTKPGQVIEKHGVTIIGITNLPSEVPYNASQMYSRNLANLLALIIKEGKMELNMEDEIIRETIVAKDGEIIHPRVKEAMAS
ncbi:MAG: Re/Si-specific NAD(P)(+) transhydrogenase subunit alpha [Calditrichaeota bacterium]|nr:MAG: Re/Si-specific NAD(P)(+) transhydrogenase subunit alpha [Calditrichota bacterium]